MNYDSDSSDGGEDYTETNVLLGYASGEATGDPVSHLGGAPTWIDGKTTPSGSLAKCKVCNGLLSLLLELNGDLPDHFPGHERRLYIWSCRRKACRRKEGSVRALRGVRVAKGSSTKAAAKPEMKTQQQATPQPQIGASLFGVKDTPSATAKSNPFSNPFSKPSTATSSNPFSASSANANPFGATTTSSEPAKAQNDEASKLPETFASKARISSPEPVTQPAPPRPHEPWPADSDFPKPYPLFQLDAEYETLDAPSSQQIPENVRMEVDNEGASGGGGKEDKEIFESSIDKTFQKFADRVGENPEQVLRYEFKGKPLLYSDSDAIGKLLGQQLDKSSSSNVKVRTTGSRAGAGMPSCQNCGAERAFEVQLTPHAITELEADELTIDGMEWGTIIMAVCSKDCKPSDVAEGEVGYLEEWVGVQWEELASKK